MQSETLFRGRHLSFQRRGRWEYVTRLGCHGIVAMVAVTKRRELVLVEQLRPPLQRRVIEIPAGLVDPTESGKPESFARAASRELKEETGYIPGTLTPLFEGPPSAGISDELIFFFLAGDLERVGPGGGDATEDITVHRVPLRDVDFWLRTRVGRGNLIDPKVFTGLYFLKTQPPQ